MPADRLNLPGATTIAAAIKALATGAAPDRIAAASGIDTDALLSAAETYHDAGHTALLDRAAGPPWFQTHIDFADWADARHTVTEHLAPRLEQLRTDGIAARWWFIRKHPHWRLRIQAAGHDTAEVLAERLTALRGDVTGRPDVTGWQPTIYEPETAAFGGPTGMDISHDLFAADSRHVLAHLNQTEPVVGDRETTILLCLSLCRGGGLDWFETGDVWRLVTQLRPLPPDITGTQLTTLASNIVTLAERDTSSTGPLFASGARLHGMAAWAGAFRSAGAALTAAATAGRLRRGLRAVLAHHVIFHWNRLGLDARQQTLLAHAAHIGMLDVEEPEPGDA